MDDNKIGDDGLTQTLAGIVGAQQVDASAEALAAHRVDGLTPRAVVSPRSPSELAQVVGWATKQGLALTPWGGGTKQGIGRPVSKLDLVVKTGGVGAIREVDEGNLTAEVEGGLTIGALQAHLAAKRLFFPLDPVEGPAATIGGIIASNASGPWRLLYRTARDQVLGMQVVLPSGEVLHTGGKTVKDVAGYNLTKPLIGSWGTLGIIIQATIRLLPMAEATAALVTRFADVEAAAGFAMAVRGSYLLPLAMELVSDSAWQAAAAGSFAGTGPGEAWLLFALAGHREPVARMLGDLQTMAGKAGALEASGHEAEDAPAVWQRRRQVSAAVLAGAPAGLRLKVSVPMAGLGRTLAATGEVASRQGLGVAYAAHAGNGVGQVFLLPGESTPQEALVAAVARLRELAAAQGGFLVVEVAPAWLKQQIDPLPARDDYAIMAAIRQSLSPANSLNPGKLA